MPERKEYKVNMTILRNSRKCFTLVNAYSLKEASRTARENHPDKHITSIKETGRTF